MEDEEQVPDFGAFLSENSQTPTHQVGDAVLVAGQRAHLESKLGDGGEGTVYTLESSGGYSAKVFKEANRQQKAAKVEYMINNPVNSYQRSDSDPPAVAWPEATVTDLDGEFLGFVMPYLPESEYVPSQAFASERLGWEQVDRNTRREPAINLVRRTEEIHSSGYAVGDWFELNIRVNDGWVSLIDCDSYSIKGTRFEGFDGDIRRHRYLPPEGVGDSHEEIKQLDRFGMAIHLFQFLMAGYHPYEIGGQQPEVTYGEAIVEHEFPYGDEISGWSPPQAAPDFTRLSPTVQRLFNRCFVDGKRNREARPSLQEWRRALTEDSQEGSSSMQHRNTSGSELSWADQIRMKHGVADMDGQGSQSREVATRPSTEEGSDDRDGDWAERIRDRHRDGMTRPDTIDIDDNGTDNATVATLIDDLDDSTRWPLKRSIETIVLLIAMSIAGMIGAWIVNLVFNILL